jgi:hypothetical protein
MRLHGSWVAVRDLRNFACDRRVFLLFGIYLLCFSMLGCFGKGGFGAAIGAATCRLQLANGRVESTHGLNRRRKTARDRDKLPRLALDEIRITISNKSHIAMDVCLSEALVTCQSLSKKILVSLHPVTLPRQDLPTHHMTYSIVRG